MSVRRLVQYLATVEKPPVSLNYIGDWFKTLGYTDEIQYRPSNSLKKLGGAFKKSQLPAPPYQEAPQVSDIYFSANDDAHSVRFSCCKELLHHFDSTTDSTATRDEVSGLVTFLSSQPNLGEHLRQFETELLNKYLALAVLVPKHFLVPYEDKYRNGGVKDAKLASLFEIPEQFVPMLFMDDFSELMKSLLK